MKQVAFKQVDVFTRVPFRGNPVAVVLDGKGLSTEEMRRIAAWTNLSETTFLLPSSRADYHLRIFTPRAELPFAGHPTIGSAHAFLEAASKPRKGRLRQECGAGVLELDVEDELLWLKAPPSSLTPLASGLGDLERGLGAKALAAPKVVNVGPVWVVAELEEVDRLVPDMAEIARFTEGAQATGVTVFARTAGGEAAIHVRSFAPAHGIPEDPVCGSGNISVAAYLRSVKAPEKRYTARQGMQLGRDGEVSIRMEGDSIFLGGAAVTCVEGKIRL